MHPLMHSLMHTSLTDSLNHLPHSPTHSLAWQEVRRELYPEAAKIVDELVSRDTEVHLPGVGKVTFSQEAVPGCACNNITINVSRLPKPKPGFCSITDIFHPKNKVVAPGALPHSVVQPPVCMVPPIDLQKGGWAIGGHVDTLNTHVPDGFKSGVSGNEATSGGNTLLEVATTPP